MRSIAIFDKVSRFSLYLLVFLIPLWFLPFTQNVLNFQKQALLGVLLFLGVVAWLARVLNQGEIQLRQSILHLPVLVLALVFGLSTLFSLWRYGSFWGWPLDLTDNFLTFLLFVILYFFITYSIKDFSKIFWLLFLLVLSSVLAGVFAILQLYQLYILPFSFAKSAAFNTVGTTNSVAVLAGAVLPLALILAFASKLLLRWILWIFAGVLLFVLLFINFVDAWFVLTAGLLVLLGFGMWNLRKRTEFGWISFPMALLVLSLFFLVFRVSLPGAPTTPVEVSPSQSAELEILQKVLKERPLWGSGPGTFVFDYAKYHSPLLNQTIFWGTRFSSGASEILDWIATKGILGGLLLAGLLAISLILGVKGLLREPKDNFNWMVGLGAFASLVALGLGLFLYPFNFTLWFLFWVLLAVLVSFLQPEPTRLSIAPPSILAVASSFIFLLILIFGLGMLFVGGQKYLAELQYFRGVRAAVGGNTQETISAVFKAARLNPAVDIYWRDLAQLYLGEVNRIAGDQALKDEEKRQQTQTAISNAVTSARQAVSSSPQNVANWNVQGFVYRNLIGIPGAETFVIQSYEKAIELEPASPFSWTELGRAYILQAQNLANQKDKEELRQEALKKAQEKLQKAVELKQDYAPAHYLLAVVFQQQGKLSDAVAKLEETKRVAPNDIGLAFQLGMVYWQQNELDKAKLEFERALSLNPDYSNARYMLGLVYDKKKEKEKAMEQFRKVAELNPDNQEVKQIIANLEKGKPALEGIIPAQPPIGENPPEIEKR